jgi:Holliday junction resolvase
MEINKSSSHSKLTGDFGEALVLYLLSKHGFECALVDHTGIDIIARNPKQAEVMGISVKSRSRLHGKESESVYVTKAHVQKVQESCRAFQCEPYVAIVVDAGETIRGYVVSMEHFMEICTEGEPSFYWKMRPQDLERYEQDPKVISLPFQTKMLRWW